MPSVWGDKARRGVFARTLMLLAAAVLAVVIVAGSPQIARAEVEPCPPVQALSGGQPLGCFHDVVSPGGSATLTVRWNASCPFDGHPPDDHPWYIVVAIQHEDGKGAGGGTQFAPKGSETFSGSNQEAVTILPSTAKADRISWQVVNHCNNTQQVIESGTCVLCRGATGLDAAGEEFIKREEGLPCKRVGRGKKAKKVCALPALEEYDEDGPESRNCTIGWGHLIHRGKCHCKGATSCADKSEKPFFKGISTKQSQSRFDKDVADAVRHAKATSPNPLSQCQMNAMADYFFNHGPGKRGDRVNRDLRAGDFFALGDDIEHHSAGVKRRLERDASVVENVNCQEC